MADPRLHGHRDGEVGLGRHELTRRDLLGVSDNAAVQVGRVPRPRVESALLPRRVRPHCNLGGERGDHGVGRPHDEASKTYGMVYPPVHKARLDVTHITETG